MNKYTVGEIIYKNRKEKGLTQSQLGEMLGVSNKAVSKWETGESFPEFSAIQPLCEILGISADELVTGKEKNNALQDSQEEKQTVVKKPLKEMSEEGKVFERKFFVAIAFGVFLCIFSVAAMFLAQLLGVAEGVSVCFLLLFVAIGVFLFIIFGIKYDNYKKCYPQLYIDKAQKYALILAIAISCIIVSPCAFLLFNSTQEQLWVLILFFLWLGLAVLSIVVAGFNIDKLAKEFGINQEEEKEDKVSGAIMLGATALFLLMGFVWNLWHPAWVVFPIGGIICGIVETVKRKN